MKMTTSKVVTGENIVVSGFIFPVRHEMVYEGPYKPETVIVQMWARIDVFDGSHYLKIYSGYAAAAMNENPTCMISGDNINLYIEAIARLSEEMKKAKECTNGD